ncbi:hypothetical protein PALB_14750 [Pseudoalteromonas luteoviolacea B = ATCC 29581]|nr:hypothetical protein PALB_14750 [Pseudoalteromonas luteoviolacea B = ATCC 29581]
MAALFVLVSANSQLRFNYTCNIFVLLPKHACHLTSVNFAPTPISNFQ